MDDEMRRRARAARDEVERGVDVDAEWRSATTWPIAPATHRTRWQWIAAAAAAVLALVVGGAIVLSGDDGDLTVVPGDDSEDSAPGVVPEPTSTTTTTLAPDPTVVTTSIPPPATTTTTSTFPTVPPQGGPAPVPWQDFPWEGSSIGRACNDEGSWCTQLAADPTGEIVSLDPTAMTLTRHGRPEVTTALPSGYADPTVVAAGPDDVVYLNVQSPGIDDPVGDLVAVSLAEGDAGREIRRWPEALDRSGDIDLVTTPEGLIGVGCCGPDRTRPETGAPVEFPWVDRSGGEVVSAIATVRIHADTLEIERDGRRWSIGYDAGDLMLRGMPPIVPTFDGGFLAALERTDNNVVVVRGWPDGSSEHAVIDAYLTDAYPALLEPSGMVVMPNGDRFARVRFFEPRPSGWDGQVSVDFETWQVTAPGLDEFLDADDVAWEHDLVAFADAVTGPVSLPETRRIEVLDSAAGSRYVEVTTMGYLDDSVAGGRYLLQVTPMATEDGTLRLAGGEFSQTCRPDRGHQDFQQALCV